MSDGVAVFAAQNERDLRPDRDAEPPPARTTITSNGRRDIGQHILHVFVDLPGGAFRTVSQIRNAPSPEYPDSPPSAGAISARLFPASGGETTVPGVIGTTRDGLRGALKR